MRFEKPFEQPPQEKVEKKPEEPQEEVEVKLTEEGRFDKLLDDVATRLEEMAKKKEGGITEKEVAKLKAARRDADMEGSRLIRKDMKHVILDKWEDVIIRSREKQE